jgi:outer membrane murein-binding lipoprotein Lpp
LVVKSRFAAWVFVVSLIVQGCVSTAKQEQATEAECTRLDAAVTISLSILKAVPDIQRQAIEECKEGVVAACISVPFAIPFTVATGILFAPMGFLIGASFPQGVICGE